MKDIIQRYLEGRANETEMKALLEWLRKKENHLVFHKFRLDWKKSLDRDSYPAESRDSWSRLQEQLARKSFIDLQRTRRLQFISRVAAIFFFMVSLGLMAYFITNREEKATEVYTRVYAENGQISKVELPDGSLVWLNSGSELKYSNEFATENRHVQLTGEAYFQVAKNAVLPLMVDCGELQVKVTGTQFNVTAFPECGFIDVVLEHGAVQLLNTEEGSLSYSLKPGEHARFNTNSRKIKVANVNPARFTSWKEGIINIYNQPLEDVVKRLELRYNQKFRIDPEIKDIRYTFTIKNEPLGDILLLMEKITPVKAVQEKDEILFKPKESRMNKNR